MVWSGERERVSGCSDQQGMRWNEASKGDWQTMMCEAKTAHGDCCSSGNWGNRRIRTCWEEKIEYENELKLLFNLISSLYLSITFIIEIGCSLFRGNPGLLISPLTDLHFASSLINMQRIIP